MTTPSESIEPPFNSQVVIRFNVVGVDPTLVDPLDIAEYLLGLHDIERRAGNADYDLASDLLEAEWGD